MTRAEFASYVDLTNLNVDATELDIRKLCGNARRFNFAAVCVSPIWVTLCHELLEDSHVIIATVIGFPSGAVETATKVFEARLAQEQGAEEFDFVIAIGKLIEGDYEYVKKDIKAVVETVRAGGGVVKVIIETAKLTPDQIRLVCKLAVEAGAHCVKTSTGFNGRGATVEDIRIMAEALEGSNVYIKASAGIGDLETAERLLAASQRVERLGMSKGAAVLMQIPE